MDAIKSMLEGFDPNRVWDMTGKSGDKGCVTEAVKMAEAAGYISLETALKARRRLGAGDNEAALASVKMIRDALEREGVVLQPMGKK